MEKTDYLTFVGRPYSLEFGALPPGRGLWADTPPLHFQAAYIEQPKEDETPAGEEKKVTWSESLMTAMRARWESLPDHEAQGPVSFSVLPTRVNLSGLLPKRGPDEPPPSKRLPLGLNFDTLQPFDIRWGEECSHLVVGGPSQSGRTNLLHSLALSIMDRNTPDEARFVLVDGSQGSLRRLAAFPHVIAWITSEEELALNYTYLKGELDHRSKHSGVDGEKPGPEIYFIIDDYDLTTEAFSLPKGFSEMIGKTIRRQGNLGFHFILSNIGKNINPDSDPLLRQLKLLRSGVSLVNVEALEALGGRTTSAMRRQELPEGRGYFLNSKQTRLVQFAFPDDEIYTRLEERYAGTQRAVWEREPSAETVKDIEQATREADGRQYSSGSYIDNIDELVEIYKQGRQQEIDESRGMGGPDGGNPPGENGDHGSAAGAAKAGDSPEENGQDDGDEENGNEEPKQE